MALERQRRFGAMASRVERGSVYVNSLWLQVDGVGKDRNVSTYVRGKKADGREKKMFLNTEMESEEIEVVMERAWDLHDKINDAIHSLSKSHFLNSIHKISAITSHPNPSSFSAQPHWVNDEPSNGHNGLGSYTQQQHQQIQNGHPTTQCGDFMQEADPFAETRSLNAIRNALEVLEDNLRFLHTLQLQQRADREVAEKILDGRELEFYKWDGDLPELLRHVKEKLNKVAEGWSRQEKNRCLEETAKSFKYSGKILRLIIS